MLQRLGDRYPESQKTWMTANARIQVRDPLAEAATWCAAARAIS